MPNDQNQPSNAVKSQTPVAVPVQIGFSEADAKSVLDLLYAQGQITKEQYEDIKVKSATRGQSAVDLLKSMHVVPEEKNSRSPGKTPCLSKEMY